MKKYMETISSVGKAVRYSFSFCFRNDYWGTVKAFGIRGAQAILGYLMIIISGTLISSVQRYITTGGGDITLVDFVEARYFIPIVIFITALFIEITLNKYSQYVSQRQRQILRIANDRERNSLKASLDVARRRSKQFDDIEQKIQELPDGWFTRISFSFESLEFIGILLGFIIFGVSLTVSHPWYVLVLIVTAVPMAITEFSAVNRFWKVVLELIPTHKKRFVLQRAFGGVTTFLQGRMFMQHEKLTEEIQKNNEFVFITLDRLRRQNLRETLLGYLFAMAGFAVVLVHAVYGTLTVGGDLGVLTVIIASSRKLQSSIRDLILQVAGQWQSVKGTIMIEEEFFGMKPMYETTDAVHPKFIGPPKIRLENVSFKYPDTDTLVLKDVSFSIAPGSKNVIIGKNGSGKSSLIGLLLRHYVPTSGRIIAGDIDLKNIDYGSWSRCISAILQNYTILERKVGDEIASADLDHPKDMERVAECARFAGFDSVIDADPNGYEAQIGTEQGGREFSGGEEQRLAVARARYRQTPVFILDEPEARLDPEAAKDLIDRVFALSGVTVIIITQHVSRAAIADQIVVLDQGELVECGTHAELISKQGRYAKMFARDEERKSSPSETN